MLCRHGWVATFAVDASDDSGMAMVHVSALMAVGLYAYGMDWREAVAARNQIVREAKARDPQIAEHTIDGVKISLIISDGGVPSFQIDTER